MNEHAEQNQLMKRQTQTAQEVLLRGRLESQRLRILVLKDAARAALSCWDNPHTSEENIILAKARLRAAIKLNPSRQ